MIDVRNLTRNYGPTRAVDAISFTVSKGEILGFLGPNGAGKTTTMKVITGYMPPTSGQVSVDGLDVIEHSLDVRRNGSWALSIMQDKLTPDKRRLVRPIFQRILSQPLGDVEPPIVCHALHALGHHRNALDAKIVEPYAKHPSALVRIRAAIAMGQIRSNKSVPVLLELILDSETNMNVRLAAHKSLKALAGGKDRGYDVKAWQLLFTLK